MTQPCRLLTLRSSPLWHRILRNVGAHATRVSNTGPVPSQWSVIHLVSESILISDDKDALSRNLRYVKVWMTVLHAKERISHPMPSHCTLPCTSNSTLFLRSVTWMDKLFGPTSWKWSEVVNDEAFRKGREDAIEKGMLLEVASRRYPLSMFPV